jgi:hypothetical protein
MNSFPNTGRESHPDRLGITVGASLLVGLLSSVAASAQPAVAPASPGQAAQQQQAPSPEERQQSELWRRSLARNQLPKQGCFTAAYPSTEWQEVPCTTAPAYPQPPRREVESAIAAQAVSAQAPAGLISSAIGSFDSVTGVTSESGPINNEGPPVANAYSLQLNTDFFRSPACAGSPNPGCRGWEQFVFSNDGSKTAAYIQYWLIQYNQKCPSGADWKEFSFHGSTSIYCVRSSRSAASVPAHPITKLGQLILTGTVGTGWDRITVTSGLYAYSAAGDNSVNAAAGWQSAEFNVFGNGGGGQAKFNAGATVVPRVELTYGGTAPPTCIAQGFTGETNNLNFGPAAPPASGAGPALVVTESSKGGASSSCAAATTVGYTPPPPPPKLVIAGDAVQTDFSGRSNGHHYVRESGADQLQAVSTIGGQEQADDPCYLGIFYKDFPSGTQDVKKGEFLGCSSKDGQGNGGSFLAPALPNGYFVTGMAVVLNNDHNKVKGFWIKGSPAACLAGLSSATVPDASNGTQLVTVNCDSALSIKQDAQERPNSIGNNTDKYDSDWERQVFCPTASIAIGVALNIEEGFGNKQVFSGLALRCRPIKAVSG